ncbi:hypothetical protein CN918_32580 [Priestia megaterium]|nr:hypothetical protein CN918_32580 [Priestia megaterium]
MNQYFNQIYNLALEMDTPNITCLTDVKNILLRENIAYEEKDNDLYILVGQKSILVYQKAVLLNTLWEEIECLINMRTDAVC